MVIATAVVAIRAIAMAAVAVIRMTLIAVGLISQPIPVAMMSVAVSRVPEMSKAMTMMTVTTPFADGDGDIPGGWLDIMGGTSEHGGHRIPVMRVPGSNIRCINVTPDHYQNDCQQCRCHYWFVHGGIPAESQRCNFVI
jgi:hypothetical protein